MRSLFYPAVIIAATIQSYTNISTVSRTLAPTKTQLTLTKKSADSGLIGLKRIPYTEILIE
jgi:hypothetical protein